MLYYLTVKVFALYDPSACKDANRQRVADGVSAAYQYVAKYRDPKDLRFINNLSELRVAMSQLSSDEPVVLITGSDYPVRPRSFLTPFTSLLDGVLGFIADNDWDLCDSAQPDYDRTDQVIADAIKAKNVRILHINAATQTIGKAGSPYKVVSLKAGSDFKNLEEPNTGKVTTINPYSVIGMNPTVLQALNDLFMLDVHYVAPPSMPVLLG